VARYLPGQPTIDAAIRALHISGGGLSLSGHDLLVLASSAVAALVASSRLFC
jgi:hypothetical protein